MFRHTAANRLHGKPASQHFGWEKAVPLFLAGIAAAFFVPRVRRVVGTTLSTLADLCLHGCESGACGTWAPLREQPGAEVEANPVDE
ncbi:MAG TPA: hypothetical protein VG713_20115, partial [Pirellulales bacterium]|nr:hypothetical protein [Pirellulales bacterium]